MNRDRLRTVGGIARRPAPRPKTGRIGLLRTHTLDLSLAPDRQKPITHLDMGVYHGTAPCGALGCLAGIALQTWPEEARDRWGRANHGAGEFGCEIDRVAAGILDLEAPEANALFHAAGCTTEGPKTAITPAEAGRACMRLADGAEAHTIWRDQGPEEQGGGR